MKTKPIIRLGIGLLLAAAMIFSLPFFAFGYSESYYGEKEHKELTAGDMEFKGCDRAVMDGILKALRELNKDGVDPALFREKYYAMLREYDYMCTQYAIIHIQHHKDINNAELGKQYDDLSLLLTEQGDECYVVLQEILAGPARDLLLAEITDLEAGLIEDFESSYDRLSKLYEQENELVQKYYDALATVDESGNYLDVLKDKNAKVGPIFKELVHLRNKIAVEYGYDDYGHYGFDKYQRDYSNEDLEALCNAVKAHFKPLSGLLDDAMDSADNSISSENISGEKKIELIEPYMGMIHPALEDSFAYMRRNHTYDIEISRTKAPMGYTISLYDYGSAFIFDSPYGNFYDYNTLIHEFGHYNQAYYSEEYALYEGSTLDVQEIPSQALETLFTAYYPDIFGASGGFMELNTISNIVYSVLHGCLYDEFQRIIYKNPDMTLEEINALSRKLAADYGVDWGEYSDYLWVEVDHNFSSPMYYIAYATSALSSLDIWKVAQNDRTSAVDKYMRISALNSNIAYREAVALAGLDDMFEEENVAALARAIRDRYAGDNFSAPGNNYDPFPAQPEIFAAYNRAPLIILAIAAIFLVLTFAYRSKKERR